MTNIERLGQRMAADGKPGEEIRQAQGWVAGDRGSIGSMSAAHGEAIHAAERELVRTCKDWRILNPGPANPSISGDRNLKQAIDELNALTAPAGVDPSELRPGQRFRFATESRGDWQKRQVYRAVSVNAAGTERGDWPGWLTEDFRIATFSPEDRVIPEPE